MGEPRSLLTRTSPNIWIDGLRLAESFTGLRFPHKEPLRDGSLSSCGRNGGGGRLRLPKAPRTPDLPPAPIDPLPPHVLPDIEQLAVSVPEGAMEWLLHEVGHYVAATPEERARPNYGLSASEQGSDGEREWQAWAFEEIILSPWGPARHFAPPSQRDGAAFAKAGPVPAEHLAHIERQILVLGLDVERWRSVYAPWVRWLDRHA